MTPLRNEGFRGWGFGDFEAEKKNAAWQHSPTTLSFGTEDLDPTTKFVYTDANDHRRFMRVLWRSDGEPAKVW